MIMKGRSSTMRRVSRTPQSCSDEGNFTRGEWNNLLFLSNISHSSSLCCAQNFGLTSCTKTMANRMQEQEGDNRIVAKSKQTTMNLAFSVSTSFSTVNSPIASKSPEILKALCRTDWSSKGKPDARDRNHDAASSSQGWQNDALLDGSTGKPDAREEDQEHLNYPEESVSTGKLVAAGYPEYPGNPGDSGTSETGRKNWPHHFHVSPDFVPHIDKVFSVVKPRSVLSPTDELNNLDVNTVMWVDLCVSLIKLQLILV